MSTTVAGKYMTFRLANEIYGLPILKVRELIGALDVTRVPGAPAFMRGVINLRGKVIPVADLKVKLGMPPIERGEQTVIMVVQAAGGAIGLLVDEVLEVMTFAEAQIEPPSVMTGAGFDLALLSGIAKSEQRIVFLLELERIIAGERIVEEARAS